MYASRTPKIHGDEADVDDLFYHVMGISVHVINFSVRKGSPVYFDGQSYWDLPSSAPAMEILVIG